ncbi:MAG: DUF4382 domain-containing protein [Candidatus Polarisedimenticolaceae bacterium]|nr:DUF4382 domain-containing protein [Candidatus Polarisedimenticolaceae bacterium]
MNRYSLYFLLFTVVGLLSACGGGGSSSSGQSSDGTVSVLITDNLTLAYSEVWVNVQSITATDANGQTVVLYEDATGQVHNLSQLVNIGALVDAQVIAAGTYTSFDILLANDIKLVETAGTTINATFDQTGNPTYTMTITGSLIVDANQTTTLVLDFDLQQFTFDVATNTVTPVVVQADPNTLNQTNATINGQVQSVSSPSQFVMMPASGGANITVDIHATGAVTNAATGAVTADTTALQAGMQVAVSGTYDATNLTITASGVQIENSVISIRHEVEGFVTSFDGSNLTLDIKEASFLPTNNTIAIANISNAIFSAGSLSLVTVGQQIEVKGNWDGATFTAVIVEIEGAPSNASSNSYIDEYAEIEGQITAINGNALTLAVQSREHVAGINVGDQITIDSTNSWFEEGGSSCLAAGIIIEAKGGMIDGTTMQANVIEFESDCGGSSSNDDDDDEENDEEDDSSEES